MTQEKSGVIFILFRDNKALMQLRDNNSKTYKNHWCFPGGGSEEGETYEETLVREVKEEYNLSINTKDCIFLMERSIDSKSRVFVCPIDHSQEPVLNEGADMKWMTIDEIKKLDIGFEQEDVVREFENMLQSHI